MARALKSVDHRARSIDAAAFSSGYGTPLQTRISFTDEHGRKHRVVFPAHQLEALIEQAQLALRIVGERAPSELVHPMLRSRD
jgi:hypothetical protein